MRYMLFNTKFEEKLPRRDLTGSSQINQIYDPIYPEALILQCGEDLLTGTMYSPLIGPRGVKAIVEQISNS